MLGYAFYGVECVLSQCNPLYSIAPDILVPIAYAAINDRIILMHVINM